MQHLMSASSPCVWLEWYSRAVGGLVGPGPLNNYTQGMRGSRNVASKSVLSPGHLDKGRDETSE